jgi:formylglycine-generating enzyme required for sulfatase activity
MPRQPATSGRDHPVVNLTWDEARSFCAWTGGRLPTRDEWEYAATEGVPWKEPRPWGDWRSREANLMNAGGLDRWDYTSPVGSFPPNAFGLYDMIGNVWEWVEDLHETSTEAYEVRTIVGGSWDTPPRAFPRRTGLSRHGRHNLYVGFRCVR